MPKVFIPQLPSRFDSDNGVWVPSVNVQPAARYGELTVMFRPGTYDMALMPTIAAMKEQMASYSAADYIVAIGDPSLIAAASCIAYKRAGIVRLLKWDRQSKDYLLSEINV